MTDITLPEKYDVITAAALASASADPVSVARDIMRDGRISMHGPEHHYLDGAAFIAAYRDAGGEIDAAACLKALAARVVSMPGAMCGLWGVCGAAASVGAAMSVIRGTGPLSADAGYGDNMAFTSSVLAEMSRIGGPRCCKRNAFLSLRIGAVFAREKLGVPMAVSDEYCDFSRDNGTCLKSACPFYPHGGRIG